MRVGAGRRRAIRSSIPRPLVTVIALGPLTNVAAAPMDSGASRVRPRRVHGRRPRRQTARPELDVRSPSRAVLAAKVPLTVAPVGTTRRPPCSQRTSTELWKGAARAPRSVLLRVLCGGSARSRGAVNRGLVARVPDANTCSGDVVPWDVGSSPQSRSCLGSGANLPPCACLRRAGTVVVRNGSSVLAPTRLSSDGVVDALVDLVCDSDVAGPDIVAPRFSGSPCGGFGASLLLQESYLGRDEVLLTT